MGHFLDYKMVNSKIVVNKVQELQVILYEIHVEGHDVEQNFSSCSVN